MDPLSRDRTILAWRRAEVMGEAATHSDLARGVADLPPLCQFATA
jgi:hypothetical protein